MNPSPRFHPDAQQLPGRMTAVMRTLAIGSKERGPRIPRVAVVRGGRVVDEQLVRDATSVTVGTSEHARIVVRDAPSLPSSFELLERVGDRYWLRFTDEMSGRIAGPDGIVALSDLRSTAHPVRGAYRVSLSEDARGKVIVGDTTFLFQIVPAPPVASRPQLPMSVKNGLGLDFRLTIIAAFSFLLHFGLAGGMYSDWMDPVITPDHSVAGFIDDLSRLQKPEPEVAVPEQPVVPRQSEQTGSAAPPQREGKPSPHARPSSHAPPSRSMSANDAALLAERADALEVGFLTSKARGPAVQAALDGRDIPIVDLTAAAEKNNAATHDHRDLRVATGGPVATGTSKLSTIGGPARSTAQDHAGHEGAVAGPTISVSTPIPEMTTVISDVDRVIAGLRPRFRKCYQDGLNNDPLMGGKATIVAKVGPNGEVLSTEVGANHGLSPGVTSCLSRVLGNATFTGNGTVTTVRVPITLTLQQ